MDFTGTPFEIVKELMPISDYLYKHHAVCVRCGTDGWVSNRKSKDQERIKIGASKEYEPLCRKCFFGTKDFRTRGGRLTCPEYLKSHYKFDIISLNT